MTEERVSKSTVNIANFSDLRIEIELLKKDVSFIKTLFDKMDKVIEKIEVQHEVLFDRTASSIDEKFKTTKEEVSELYDTIESTKLQLNERMESIEKILRSEIQSVSLILDDHKKETGEYITKINKIGYGIGGVTVFIGWVLSNVDTIKKFFN